MPPEFGQSPPRFSHLWRSCHGPCCPACPLQSSAGCSLQTQLTPTGFEEHWTCIMDCFQRGTMWSQFQSSKPRVLKREQGLVLEGELWGLGWGGREMSWRIMVPTPGLQMKGPVSLLTVSEAREESPGAPALPSLLETRGGEAQPAFLLLGTPS